MVTFVGENESPSPTDGRGSLPLQIPPFSSIPFFFI